MMSLTKLINTFYQTEQKYNSKKPIFVIPIADYEDTELSDKLLSVNPNTIDQIDKLDKPVYLEIEGNIVYEELSVLKEVGMRGGSHITSDVTEMYTLICGNYEFDITSSVENLKSKKTEDIWDKLKENPEIVVQGEYSPDDKKFEIHALNVGDETVYSSVIGTLFGFEIKGDSIWKHTIDPEYNYRKRELNLKNIITDLRVEENLHFSNYLVGAGMEILGIMYEDSKMKDLGSSFQNTKNNQEDVDLLVASQFIKYNSKVQGLTYHLQELSKGLSLVEANNNIATIYAKMKLHYETEMQK